ncbi:MAG: hypothetical protein JNM85_05315 [Chthonomonas sp.]|nr:hypothetical protein [Chthonomonas sp.]
MKSFRAVCIALLGVIGAVLAGIYAESIQLSVIAFCNQYLKTGIDIELYRSKLNLISNISVAIIGMVLGASLGAQLAKYGSLAGTSWDRMAAGDKVNLFLGIFVGILASLPVYALLQAMLAPNYIWIPPVATFGFIIGLSALGVFALRSMGEVLPWYGAASKPKKTGFKVLDTNVIIDGRIYDVARTGFLEGRFYIPQFVLDELQYIADSPDPLRRQRGRRGLDILRLMQGDFEIQVGTYDRVAPDEDDEVDSRLVTLTKALGAELVTNDVNLNRVASLQNVKVLNLNDLAMALKPNILPRERMDLVISREGSQHGQGVGYLDDGTMVVVENARQHLGESVAVVVTQVIQTERGKMIFGEVAGPGDSAAGQKRRTRSPENS